MDIRSKATTTLAVQVSEFLAHPQLPRLALVVEVVDRLLDARLHLLERLLVLPLAREQGLERVGRRYRCCGRRRAAVAVAAGGAARAFAFAPPPLPAATGFADAVGSRDGAAGFARPPPAFSVACTCLAGSPSLNENASTSASPLGRGRLVDARGRRPSPARPTASSSSRATSSSGRRVSCRTAPLVRASRRCQSWGARISTCRPCPTPARARRAPSQPAVVRRCTPSSGRRRPAGGSAQCRSARRTHS